MKHENLKFCLPFASIKWSFRVMFRSFRHTMFYHVIFFIGLTALQNLKLSGLQVPVQSVKEHLLKEGIEVRI